MSSRMRVLVGLAIVFAGPPLGALFSMWATTFAGAGAEASEEVRRVVVSLASFVGLVMGISYAVLAEGRRR